MGILDVIERQRQLRAQQRNREGLVAIRNLLTDQTQNTEGLSEQDLARLAAIAGPAVPGGVPVTDLNSAITNLSALEGGPGVRGFAEAEQGLIDISRRAAAPRMQQIFEARGSDRNTAANLASIISNNPEAAKIVLDADKQFGPDITFETIKEDVGGVTQETLVGVDRNNPDAKPIRLGGGRAFRPPDPSFSNVKVRELDEEGNTVENLLSFNRRTGQVTETGRGGGAAFNPNVGRGGVVVDPDGTVHILDDVTKAGAQAGARLAAQTEEKLKNTRPVIVSLGRIGDRIDSIMSSQEAKNDPQGTLARVVRATASLTEQASQVATIGGVDIDQFESETLARVGGAQGSLEGEKFNLAKALTFAADPIDNDLDRGSFETTLEQVDEVFSSGDPEFRRAKLNAMIDEAIAGYNERVKDLNISPVRRGGQVVERPPQPRVRKLTAEEVKQMESQGRVIRRTVRE